MENHKIIKLIEESNHLPKTPKSFGEIYNMLLEPSGFNMDACIEKISQNPKLETAVIRALNNNSKLKREIKDIRDAVVYLGAKNTRIIWIAYITRLLLPERKGRAQVFSIKTYWKHSIGTSIASYMIAEKTGLCDKEKMFTSGLVHDIGETVLDICLPEYLDKIFMLQKKGLHQIAAEKIVLGGITHSEIGLWICKKIGLQQEVLEMVAFHHTPFLTKKYITEVQIMHLGDSISTNYYKKLLGNERTFIYAEKIMNNLGVDKEFVDEIIRILPKEVGKVNRIIDFDF